jgi:hypothetical protein
MCENKIIKIGGRGLGGRRILHFKLTAYGSYRVVSCRPFTCPPRQAYTMLCFIGVILRAISHWEIESSLL